jgi:H+/gluconate symporter-like permease
MIGLPQSHRRLNHEKCCRAAGRDLDLNQGFAFPVAPDAVALEQIGVVAVFMCTEPTSSIRDVALPVRRFDRTTGERNVSKHQTTRRDPRLIAISPLVVVGVMKFVLTKLVARYYGSVHEFTLGTHAKPVVTQISSVAAIWALERALLLGILTVFAFAWRPVLAKFAEGSKAAVAGSLLASLNTASEYGFGGVIAMLPGFVLISDALRAIPNPLINEAVSVTVLAGITGLASGGMSIALAAMADTFISAAEAAKIPLEVLQRAASMASGGMDTLPHNGAVITLLAVTGLTHKEAYKKIL